MRLIDWLRRLFWPDPAPPLPGPPPADLEATREALLAAHNRERSGRGVPLLVRHHLLDRAAQGHAQDMAARGRLSHTGGDGSGMDERLRRVGFNAGWAGENIAQNRGGVDAAMSQWMSSPGHRSNILRPNYDFVGFGVAVGLDGNTYWCVDFGGD